MRHVEIVDTTVRDGHQSLWALGLRSHQMAGALPHIARSGVHQIELMPPGAQFKKMVRDLRENPWDYVHAAVANADPARLRWHGQRIGIASLSGSIPKEVGMLLLKKIVDLGIRHTRITDNWNDMAALGWQRDALESVGMTPVLNIMYAVSERHTDEYFVERARQGAALKPYRLCFKDVIGLLTPERTRELLSKMMAAAPGVEWEFHAHCTNGLGPLNAIEAAKAGVGYIHAAVPPLANGSSQPSVITLVRNLRALDFEVSVDLEALAPASEHLHDVARRERLPVGKPQEFDARLYRHQVPGGMISSLRFQLGKLGMAHRLDEVLDEIARVREELGHPIMATPLSQFVGAQAATNVVVGERYAQVSDDIIHYAYGRHGHEALAAMDPEVRAKILERPRARAFADYERPEPTLAQLRAKLGPVSDEDLILRSIVGDDAVEAVGPPGRPKHAQRTGQPIAALVRELAEQPRQRFVAVDKDGLKLRVHTA